MATGNSSSFCNSYFSFGSLFWRNCIRAQRKVNLCAPGAPKGPKVGTFVRQYEIVCANDAGRAPRKYPVGYGLDLRFWVVIAIIVSLTITTLER